MSNQDEPPVDIIFGVDGETDRDWLRMWQQWFTHQAGPDRKHCVDQIFRLARRGATRHAATTKKAKEMLAPMLETMANAVRNQK